MEPDNGFGDLAMLLEAAEKLEESSISTTVHDSENTKHVSSVEKVRYKEDLNFLNNIETAVEEEKGLEKNKSLLHSGDTDSSDDEENRHHNSQYNKCGKEIKSILSLNETTDCTSFRNRKESSWKFKPDFSSLRKSSSSNSSTISNTTVLDTNKRESELLKDGTESNSSISSDKLPESSNELSVKKSVNPKLQQKTVFYDPVFGLRLSNPLVSSALLKERMTGREAIPFCKLKYHIERGNTDSDWVIGGVIVSKSDTKTSQKGNQYAVWTLSDLKDDLKTAALFLFKTAHKELWKTPKGTAIAVLNPFVMERRKDSRDEACLSVDNCQKVMVLGQCKDLGYCKSKKKNGENCTAFVNVSKCDYCIHHVQQEYQKCSRRAGLQSSSLIGLRNKVLGKNEVFYAGKSYMAIPAKKSKRLVERDEGLLKSLSGQASVSQISDLSKKSNSSKNGPVNKLSASRIEVSNKQRYKDLERLKKLGVDLTSDIFKEFNQDFNPVASKEISIDESRVLAKNTISKLKSSLNTAGPASLPESMKKNDVPEKCTTEPEFSKKDNSSEESTTGKIVPTITKSSYESDPLDFTENITTEKNSILRPNLSIEVKSSLDTKSSDKKISTIKRTETKTTSQSTILKTITQKDASQNNTSKDKDSRMTKVQEGELLANFSAKEVLFKNSLLTRAPTLTRNSSGTVDLSSPINRRVPNKSRIHAIDWIERNGPIKKVDPMSLKGRGLNKRVLENLETPDEKRQKIEEEPLTVRSEKFKQIMAAKSSHSDLIEQNAEEAKEKYFNNLERKEQLEEKMLSTFKVACKAVRCLQCKYTSFSASDLCKSERHPLKVYDTFKRFFKCGSCSYRTVSLEMIPLTECKKCGESKWVKTSMVKEKCVKVGENLSIRGGEEKFFGSVVTDANINLMVPD